MTQLSIPQAMELALAHHRDGRLAEAESIYRQILGINPDSSDALHWLGVIARQTNHAEDELRLIARALELNPNDALIRMDMGETLKGRGQLEAALEHYQAALRLRPDMHGLHNDTGVVYRMLRRYDEALRCFHEALRLLPSPQADANLGSTLADLGRLEEALSEISESLRLRPNHSMTLLTKARVLFLMGDLAPAFDLYRLRMPNPEIPYPQFIQPMWDGSDPKGRSIAVVAEQGAGDTIQFVRYLPLLAQRGAKPVLLVTSEMRKLMESLRGPAALCASGESAPPFDFHIPLLHLPHFLGTTLQTVPAHVPYLSADPSAMGKWREKLSGYAGQLKVGLVWAGSPRHKGDKHRSISFSALAPLADIEGITLFSLQKGAGAEQVTHVPSGMNLIEISSELTDWNETAAVLAHLDLLISVDTAPAHLAGALARPVWTLLPYEPDWRWMLNRDDSPWYPTMRLFRQPSPGDWDSVIKRVAQELRQASSRGFNVMPHAR